MPTINLDEILSDAEIGINRAQLFMGFGVNVVEDHQFKSYQLYEHTAYLGLLPTPKDDVELEVWKNEFGKWVVANGLREVTESLNAFLDKVNWVCLLFEILKGKTPQNEADKLHKKYLKMGMEEKISNLELKYGLEIKEKSVLLSINRARNCLTHRRGIVGRKDLLGDAKTMEVKWIAFKLYVCNKEGIEMYYELPLKEMVDTASARKVVPGYFETKREFKLGEEILLNPKELVDICQYVRLTIGKIKNSVAEYGTKLGFERVGQEAGKV